MAVSIKAATTRKEQFQLWRKRLAYHPGKHRHRAGAVARLMQQGTAAQMALLTNDDVWKMVPRTG
jgi:hypothetical protein